MIKYFVDKINRFINIRAIQRSAYFDEKWYKSYNFECILKGSAISRHYYDNGIAHKVEPNRYFRSSDYFSLNPNMNNVRCCPLSHYLGVGKYLGFVYNRHLDLDLYSNVSVASGKIFCGEGDYKICSIIHMYPDDSCLYVEKYILNIPKYVDIHILTDTREKSDKFLMLIRKMTQCNVYSHIVNNIGRDTSALLIGAKSIVKKYDLFCFIHVKQSPQCGYGDSWREYLFHHLLGSQKGIESILDCFKSNENVGMIFPPIYPVHMYSDLWDSACNKEGVEKLMKNKFGVNINISIDDKFPVGGMFWARTKAVSSLFDILWDYDDFKDDKTADGALRHYIERIWPFVVQKFGFLSVEMLQRHVPRNKPNKFAQESLVFYASECWDCDSELDVRFLSSNFSKVYVISILNSSFSQKSSKIQKQLNLPMPRNVEFCDAANRNRINIYLELICKHELYSYNAILCLHDGVKILQPSFMQTLDQFFKSKIDFSYSDITQTAYGESENPSTDLMIFSNKVIKSGILCELRDMVRAWPNAKSFNVERALWELLQQGDYNLKNITDMHFVNANNCSLSQYPLAYIICGSPIYLKDSVCILGKRWKEFKEIISILFSAYD